jgi:hypothetical protein
VSSESGMHRVGAIRRWPFDAVQFPICLRPQLGLGRLVRLLVLCLVDRKVDVSAVDYQFDALKSGVILALAAMPDRKTVPVKNKSRLAGVSLNFNLQPRLDFDGKGPKIGDVFAVLLVSRDKDKAGKIEEIAVGISRRIPQRRCADDAPE